jgi:hypothetical protein
VETALTEKGTEKGEKGDGSKKLLKTGKSRGKAKAQIGVSPCLALPEFSILEGYFTSYRDVSTASS